MRAKGSIPRVAGRHDDDHARVHETIHFDAQRALAAREPLGFKVVADAEVDAMNQQTAAVSVDLLDLGDGGDDVAYLAVPVLVEHSHADQLAGGRHGYDSLDVQLLIGNLALLVAIA